MNAEDRAAARARCEAATEGPWRVMTETRGRRQLPFAVDAKHLTWRVSTVVGAEVNPHDAEFIAHARTDLPAALEALNAVEKERDALKAALVEIVRLDSVALPWGDEGSFAKIARRALGAVEEGTER